MDWKKISIVTDDIDGVSNQLYMLDIYEFEVVDSFDAVKAELAERAKYWDFIDEEKMKALLGNQRIIVYVPEDDADTGRRIKDAMSSNPRVADISEVPLADEDWVNSWRKYFTPINVGENIVVVPEWEQNLPGDKKVIRIDPGMIFGTGGHETTRLCLLELEKYIRQGDAVLDLGCGSGILAIGALLCGAASAHCIDIEENAKTIVPENAALNGIEDIQVTVGDIIEDKKLIAQLTQTQYDLVAANIVADVIIAILPLVRACLKPEGTFVCSGIIDGRAQDVRRGLASAGFKIITEQSEDKWTAFTVRQNHE